jgi:hypothetical protein
MDMLCPGKSKVLTHAQRTSYGMRIKHSFSLWHPVSMKLLSVFTAIRNQLSRFSLMEKPFYLLLTHQATLFITVQENLKVWVNILLAILQALLWLTSLHCQLEPDYLYHTVVKVAQKDSLDLENCDINI